MRISHPYASRNHNTACRTPSHLAPHSPILKRYDPRISHPQQLAPHTHLAPLTPYVAPIRISHHIRLFFNVITRASRTRSNSHPIRISHP